MISESKATDPSPGAPLNFDTAETAFHLSDLSLRESTLCGAAIRGLGTQAESMEQVAGKVVRFLYERFVDDQEQRAFALVRYFETRIYAELEDELKPIVNSSLNEPSSETSCMILVATAGDQDEWNDRTKSVGHRVIPLPSEDAVERLPMIAQLIRQLGLQVSGVLHPDMRILLETVATDVFHVRDALGSPYIPAQNEFVIPFGIKSVVGFGDLLPAGKLFAVIMFSKLPISRETAILFSHLSLSLRIALLPFVDDANETETRMASLGQLLNNYENIVAHQEVKLRNTLADLSRSNAELERFNRLTIGREMRVIELKKQINELLTELGREAPYELLYTF